MEDGPSALGELKLLGNAGDGLAEDDRQVGGPVEGVGECDKQGVNVVIGRGCGGIEGGGPVEYDDPVLGGCPPVLSW